MGSKTANVSRNMYDERLRYYVSVLQQAVSVVDADYNDQMSSFYSLIRRVQQLLGDGVASSSNDWKVVGSSLVNDFTLTGGNSSAEGAARIWVSGHLALLDRNVTYKGIPGSGIVGEAQRSIHSKITSISHAAGQTIITDTSANYATNELQGRNVVANISDGTSYPVVSNTATAIIVTGDATGVAAVGDRYRVELSTPSGGSRTDYVYLNCYLDEVDSTEDSTLLHSFSTPAEAMRRYRLEQNIFVREGDATVFANYTDSDGNPHFVLKLGQYTRADGVGAIDAGDVTDSRPTVSVGGGSGSTVFRPSLVVSSNGQTTFSLGSTPSAPEKTVFSVDGIINYYGASKDYTISGSTLTFLDRHYTLTTAMELDIFWIE